MTFDRFQWMNAWRDDEHVDDGMISVLAVLMSYMNIHGICHPSLETIDSKIQRSKDTVRRRIRSIEKAGYISTENKLGLGIEYRALTPSTGATGSVGATPSMGATGSTDATPPLAPVPPHPLHGCKGTPSTGATLTDQEQTNEQTKEQSSGGGGGSQDLPPKKKSSADQPPQPQIPVAEFEDGDDPAQRLIVLSQEAGISFGIFQAQEAWSMVDAKLEGDDRWAYLRWKLAEMQAGIEDKTINRRAAFRYLTSDIDRWKDRGKTKPAKGDRRNITEYSAEINAAAARWEEKNDEATVMANLEKLAAETPKPKPEFSNDEIPF